MRYSKSPDQIPERSIQDCSAPVVFEGESWSRYKQLGSLPADLPEPERSTAEMTLREILEVKGKMQLGHKRRVILDGLSCSVTRASPSAMDTDAPNEEEFDVEKLAPVLLRL